MKRTYEVAEQGDKRGLAEFLKRESQFLLPMVELVERTELAIDEVIAVMGRATLEAVLAMSAEGVAGPKQAGKARPAGEAVWYGRQSGQVYLSDRKVRVERPRLRRRGQGTGGEVEVPAYEAMNRPGPVGQRMLEILLAGVSTRKYARVIPAMAETVGVSRSAVSRETTLASERVLEELMERRLDGWDLLVIYLDGIQFGDYHVLGAVGVDVEGKKHVLGVREGASENAEVARALLEDLVVRGVDTGRRRLFVLDGSKALRSALDRVFGRQHPVQRYRNHKAVARVHLRPAAIPFWEVLMLDDGNVVGVISLPADAPDKPYKAKRGSAWVTQVRVGTTIRDATDAEEARLYMQSGHLNSPNQGGFRRVPTSSRMRPGLRQRRLRCVAESYDPARAADIAM